MVNSKWEGICNQTHPTEDQNFTTPPNRTCKTKSDGIPLGHKNLAQHCFYIHFKCQTNYSFGTYRTSLTGKYYTMEHRTDRSYGGLGPLKTLHVG